jgi:hypothetical protein
MKTKEEIQAKLDSLQEEADFYMNMVIKFQTLNAQELASNDMSKALDKVNLLRWILSDDD